VVALTKVIAAFNEQITVLEQQLSASFRAHRSAGICSLTASPGARAYYDELRTALRQVGNRLVGILHGSWNPAPATTSTPPGGHRYGTPEPAAA
jgi:hypothetical protein